MSAVTKKTSDLTRVSKADVRMKAEFQKASERVGTPAKRRPGDGSVEKLTRPVSRSPLYGKLFVAFS